MPFGVGGKSRQIGIPAVRQFALLHRVDLLCQVGKFAAVGFEQLLPGLAQFAAAPAEALREMLAHAVRHEKFGVLRPAVILLGEPHLVFAERLAVSGAGVLLVRRAVADVAVDHDQRRRVAGLAEFLQQPGKTGRVVGVREMMHLPAIGAEARGHIFAERQRRYCPRC